MGSPKKNENKGFFGAITSSFSIFGSAMSRSVNGSVSIEFYITVMFVCVYKPWRWSFCVVNRCDLLFVFFGFKGWSLWIMICCVIESLSAITILILQVCSFLLNFILETWIILLLFLHKSINKSNMEIFWLSIHFMRNHVGYCWWLFDTFRFRLPSNEEVEVINPEGGKEDAEEEAQRGRWKDEVTNRMIQVSWYFSLNSSVFL